ncbi:MULTISPECIES: UxaA family hydrolase [Burkholderia cepacia complex]|uniref:UxaA family hydrolase n=1 Tax=Burkholderia cepacia complex TaxID=87882 RepID=UPI0023DDCFD8|nr:MULTISPECIES: altronate dehydratase family protein [Burkholderia cepacia complex]MDF3090330.1 altronate dehydratase family protein [Burkholderia semiarida]MDF3102580.1 altronate dehydratase family protein [Burkholderia semiarida]WJN79557.1 Altronate dehydratase [Burkholderia anthina]
MKPPAIVILHGDDNVAVALDALAPDVPIDVRGAPLRLADAVPAGHKVATAPIARGDAIVKCGQPIGIALRDIAAGEHVHVHNVGMPERHAHDDGPAGDAHDVPADRRDTFDGFVRPDGSVGTRNYVGVIASVNCSASVCHAIADAYRHGALDAFGHVDGVVAITHQSGCGMSATGDGIELLRRTLVGYARNPNFAGVLLVGLGCEVNQVGALAQRLDAAAPGTVRTLVIQDEGGVRDTVARGVSIVRELVEAADGARRSTVPASRLTVGLQCGGSDGYSGITANPALGAAVDLLVRNGGTAILSETPEIYGAEHLLIARAASRDVAGRLLGRLQWWERYVADNGGEMNNNPSPGNLAGGITTILEKSLGAVSKGGRSPLRAVYDYAEPVRQAGLVFMDTPGYDPVSATGQIAGGANLVCFTTGRGSVFGSKPVPTIKIATTSGLFERMQSDMDFDSGGIVAGSLTVDEAGARLFRLMLDVASGRRSRSEDNGIGEREFVPWLRGAVM